MKKYIFLFSIHQLILLYLILLSSRLNFFMKVKQKYYKLSKEER